MKPRAIFLDRDGTLIEDSGYLDAPEKVHLLPGVAEAVRAFSELGFRVIIVSNQSGVARGLFDEETLTAVHDRAAEMLAQEGAHLDAAYYCPFLAGDEATVAQYRLDSPLRKPQPGMLLQAAEEHDLDLSASWMIGDALSDVEAGARAGCSTILLDPQPRETYGHLKPTHVVATLTEAAELLKRLAPAPPPPGEEPAGEPPADETVLLLRQIRDQVDHLQRQERYHDFSFMRVFAALLQMVAIVTALWGVISILDERYTAAAAQLLLACFLQLGSLSAFVVDRFH